ncbi:HAD family hydrolase [Shewanella sp. 202IG2-18]|uniref:HAD family hydrolase n=1 Tax=Parashewanella hymeniacidonis TaxID=2807618 RepID=UPI001960B402|nr:HAD family hydrolase [Parashewanella hymeniacidonis]MBM7070767.1 HAD family hydrolase [Parashewanella hymeniacidonis]
MNLALFDFDGTITTADTFTEFIKQTTPKRRKIIGKLALAPIIVGYKLGLIPAHKARPKVAHFVFKGRNETEVFEEGKRFADHYISTVLRQEAIERIQWHKDNADRIVVVSASINPYLTHWCEQHDLELLCSKLEVKNGILTGNYFGADCSRHEKVNRINALLNVSDFNTIYAYGDTDEDNEMLAIADEKFFQWRKIN